MVEIVVEVPLTRINKKLLKDLREDINHVVRLRIASERLLAAWDKRLSGSKLTEEDALRLGRQANKEALREWVKKGWI